MNIPLPYLQALVVFGDSQNMTQAALRLGLTQSALSKQLQSLEKLLPQKALAAEGRKKILTPYGRTLSDDLREKLEGLSEIVSQAGHKWLSEGDSLLRLGAGKGLFEYYGDKISFGGRLHLTTGEPGSLTDSLTRKHLDAAILPFALPQTDFVSKLLFKENFHLLIPKKFMKEKPSFSEGLLKKLATLPSLEDKTSDSACSRLFLRHGFTKRPAPRRVFEHWPTLAAWAAQNLGWTLIPGRFATPQKNFHTLPVPIGSLPSTSWYLIYRKDLGSVPWFKSFTQETTEFFKN